MARRKKHRVGDVWKARRKVGKHRRDVYVKKIGRDKYKIRVVKAKNRHVNVGRSHLLDKAYPYTNKAEPWERG